jgi:vacuole morphology and inheritance protein 14
MTSGSPPPQPVTGTSPANTIRKDSDSVDPLKSSPSDPLTHAPTTNTANSSKPLVTSSSTSNVGSLRIKPSQQVPTSEPVTPVTFEFPGKAGAGTNKTDSPTLTTPQNAQVNGTPKSPVAENINDDDVFDVRETVNVLTLQFLSDHAETRIAALEWLLMLHLKAPQKVGPGVPRSASLCTLTDVRRLSREIAVPSLRYLRRYQILQKTYVPYGVRR